MLTAALFTTTKTWKKTLSSGTQSTHSHTHTHTTHKYQNFGKKAGPYFLQSILMFCMAFYSIPLYFVAENAGPDSLNRFNILLMDQTQGFGKESFDFMGMEA